MNFGVKSNTIIRFPDPDFLTEYEILAMWGGFPLISAFYVQKIHHISTSGLFDLLT